MTDRSRHLRTYSHRVHWLYSTCCCNARGDITHMWFFCSEYDGGCFLTKAKKPDKKNPHQDDCTPCDPFPVLSFHCNIFFLQCNRRSHIKLVDLQIEDCRILCLYVILYRLYI